MRITYYCQHVLGIGHLKRSLEICKHLGKSHETTLILGGPPVDLHTRGIKTVQLPGLQMDDNFKNLVPCNPSSSLAATKEERRRQLYNHFEENQPHCFITELYPFGRKAFRFELDPVLIDIAQKTLAPCTCVCSVRDILVEKTEGRKKWEDRVIKSLNTHFDAILIHADDSIVTLGETFGPIEHITPPMYYTGFVCEASINQHRPQLRKKLALEDSDTLVVASAGGGNVGSELLRAVADAFPLLAETFPGARLQIFTGPYCDSKTVNQLKSLGGQQIHVGRFADNFMDWLTAADLSISMAGYNTCMNLVQTGVPALVYPFLQNREQTLRAQKLGRHEPITVLSSNDLAPEALADKMFSQLQRPRGKSCIALDGAARSAQIIESLMQ